MRDDAKKWPALRDTAQEIIAPELCIKTVHADRLKLLSGTAARRQTNLDLIEWPGMAKAKSYALSLRRDRVLEVNGPDRVEGWDASENIAVSDVTDAYTQVELTGRGAFQLLCRGAELDLQTPSRSVSRLLFGLSAFLYRHDNDQTYRIHVAASQDEALWHALHDASRHLA